MSFWSKLGDIAKGALGIVVASAKDALPAMSEDIINAVKAEVDELDNLDDKEKAAAKLGIDLVVNRLREALS
jgi:hypothetical protein